jgi:glycosyltransferase involved in cell wall biosynthesis
LVYLPDAILDLRKLSENKNNKNLIELEKSKKIILAVGRLTRQKNFDFLIKEFNKFIKKRDDYLLYIIGEGEERQSLEKLIKENNLNEKAFLLGYQGNVYSYMKRSEIFILSSLWEEVGFVIVEAAINNLYVISSDCPNGPRDFLNDGKNGILFQNNTKDEIYKSLLKFESFSVDKKFCDKVILKKNSKIYSKFNHFRVLKKIIFNTSLQ